LLLRDSQHYGCSAVGNTYRHFRSQGICYESASRISDRNGKVGSGLTIAVGQNNAGKSTIAEGFAAVAGRALIIRHFPEGKRSKAAGDKISITLTFSSGYKRSAKTVAVGGSQAQLKTSGVWEGELHIMVLPSRRFFTPFFSADPTSRMNYMVSLAEGSERSQPVNQIAGRLLIFRRITRPNLTRS